MSAILEPVCCDYEGVGQDLKNPLDRAGRNAKRIGSVDLGRRPAAEGGMKMKRD
jgi:hypothetical protein